MQDAVSDWAKSLNNMPRTHDQSSIELADFLFEDRVETAAEETSAGPSLDRRTLLLLVSAGFSFFVAGVNDGSLGVLIPWVIQDYGINTAILSSVYGASFLGWFTAALTNTHLSQHLDLGAVLVLGAILQVIARALRAWPTPFGLYVTTFWLTCLGQAYQDTHANAYVAIAVKGAHRWLGFIHAMYMAGCLVGPFAASPIASSRGPSSSSSPWYFFYTIPLGLGVLNVIFCFSAFSDTGISVGSRLFPADIRSTALSLVFVFAQIGGSLFPVITELVSSSKGVWVLQPMLVGLISATAISWLLVPQPKTSNAELQQE